MIRAFITVNYPVRAHKGERKARNGTLLKTIQLTESTLGEAESEVAKLRDASEYGRFLCVDYHDWNNFARDPLGDKPLKSRVFAML